MAVGKRSPPPTTSRIQRYELFALKRLVASGVKSSLVARLAEMRTGLCWWRCRERRRRTRLCSARRAVYAASTRLCERGIRSTSSSVHSHERGRNAAGSTPASASAADIVQKAVTERKLAPRAAHAAGDGACALQRRVATRIENMARRRQTPVKAATKRMSTVRRASRIGTHGANPMYGTSSVSCRSESLDQPHRRSRVRRAAAASPTESAKAPTKAKSGTITEGSVKAS
jgi:hypothetical protein